jgi:hypothetical protein
VNARRLVSVALALGAITTCGIRAASAEVPEILIFGGGWGPEGTEASIERHVQLLADATRAKQVLFAAGRSQTVRAVQETAKSDEATIVLARLFDHSTDLHVRYRATKLAPSGAASRAALLDALKKLDRRRAAIVFGAGHGAKATETEPAAIELWGPDDRVTAKDLAKALARRGRPTAFVLGHCHSGAFADVAYVGGDPKNALAAPSRCVLAAVPADREASGCTPDIGDPSAPAYLAQFATALTSEAADYDRNGTITLEEAHAFAVIEDRTVDVPVRTSELFVDAELGERAPDPTAFPMRTILDAASPAERAVLLTRPPLVPGKTDLKASDVRAKLDALDRRIERDAKALDDLVDGRETARRGLIDAALAKWPELANRLHPTSRKLLAGDATEVVRFVKNHADHPRVIAAEGKIRRADANLVKLEREAARLERWLRTARYVLGRKVVEEKSDARAKKGLTSLLACERLMVR